MKRYERYKNTGIPWIKEIPYVWDLIKIGAVFRERIEKVSDKDFMPLSVTKKGILPQLADVAKSEAHNNRKKICKGDIAINSRSDRKGSSGLSPYEGSASLINIVMKPVGIQGKYANYVLKSINFQEEFYRNGTGIVADLWSTNYQTMKRIQIPLPSKFEQKKIVDFLDYKISRIDDAIELEKKKKGKIEKIEKIKLHEIILGENERRMTWSEEVDGFKKVKIKWVVDVCDKKVDSGYPYVGLENIDKWAGTYEHNKIIKVYSDAKMMKKRDIGISLLRPYLAKAFIAVEECAVSSEICVMKSKKYSAELIKEIFLDYKFISELNSFTYGTKMPRANWGHLGNMYIPEYSDSEANKIVDKINTLRANKIRLVSNIDETIEKLKSLKQSLISAVVMGQIDVRDFQIPEEVE